MYGESDRRDQHLMLSSVGRPQNDVYRKPDDAVLLIASDG